MSGRYVVQEKHQTNGVTYELFDTRIDRVVLWNRKRRLLQKVCVIANAHPANQALR